MLPCLALALFAHPGTTHNIVHRVLWALCVYVEAVSVLPQLRMMQKAQVSLPPVNIAASEQPL
jgi:ER lumen protein retaining receptor